MLKIMSALYSKTAVGTKVLPKVLKQDISKVDSTKSPLESLKEINKRYPFLSASKQVKKLTQEESQFAESLEDSQSSRIESK